MKDQSCIAFLSSEIPALSATFVYEELLALEQRGYVVAPVTVHKPIMLATSQKELAQRTFCLYDESAIMLALKGGLGLFRFNFGTLKALRWLISDVRDCGFRVDSFKLIYQFLVAVKLAKFLRRNHCVHLHVHFAHVPTQIAMYAAALANVPFTVMAHANDIFERGLLLPQKARRSAKFLTISEFNRQYLLSCGLSEDKLAVVRCGVSFNIYGDSQALVRDDGVFRLGSLGRLVEKKGFDVLIRALAQLRSLGYAVNLSIAGDGPLRSELEILVGGLGLGDAVEFIGALSHQQVADWMRQLDGFVLACKVDANGDMDGIPVVLMEAMSQAVPVISTKLTGIPELILDGLTGLLAVPGDHASLANKIEELINCQDRLSLVAAAQRHIQSEFSQSVNLDRLTGFWGSADNL